MKPDNRKRLVLFLIAVFLLFNILFLFKIELVNRFAGFSVFRIIFYPSRLALGAVNFLADRVTKIKQLSRAYDMFVMEKKQREILEAENRLLKEKLSSFERLNSLKEIEKKYPFRIETSRIIGRNPLFWHQHVLIEGGKDREFSPGMPVMTKDGLVGKITQVFSDYSQVLLVIDPEFSVDVRGENSGVLALCSGIGTSIMKINYVPRFEELKLGEMMVTSGLDMAFPEGIPVGYLIEVNKPFGAYFLDAYVIPVVDVLKIREVMVIKEFGKKR